MACVYHAGTPLYSAAPHHHIIEHPAHDRIVFVTTMGLETFKTSLFVALESTTQVPFSQSLTNLLISKIRRPGSNEDPHPADDLPAVRWPFYSDQERPPWIWQFDPAVLLTAGPPQDIHVSSISSLLSVHIAATAMLCAYCQIAITQLRTWHQQMLAGSALSRKSTRLELHPSTSSLQTNSYARVPTLLHCVT